METDQCPICHRKNVEFNEHHLVPVQKGGKKAEKVKICTNCHDHIHAVFTNNKLKNEINSLEAIIESKEMRKFAKYIGKKPYKRYLKRKKKK